ncbi:aspartate aminotransferase family protein [Occultella glacieicola]|uniref:Aspartate aminotransferase family protein n=1 Tax=Occultella glacieicola TaxID=2518684 RepID=A0ABY2DXY9_9MICO|nr:aspartate aminotransferase family protein [Occultella glacieicola]TDE88543.1 aspartate aminotransferase family protein [Occultella glacieicola]
MSTIGTLWHPQTHMPSASRDRLVIASGDGAWVTTEDGQRLLDLPAGLWHANIGHGRERLAHVAAEQMSTLETYHLFGAHATRPALDLADRLSDLVPIESATIFFTSGGSDSIDTACKLARRYWQTVGEPARTVILSRDTGYHGLHGFGTSIAGLGFNRDGYGSDSLIPETARVPRDDLTETERIILEIGPENIAALVVEPVVGTGGVFPPSTGYLQGLRELTRRHKILLVADEVITGFGRTGAMFACERWGIEPDMITMAKGVTSGYLPLGAVAIAPHLAEPFFLGDDAPMFRHGLTYSGHATVCAVAMANLDILEEEQLLQRVRELEPVLETALNDLATSPLVADVRSVGLMAGIQLVPELDGGEVVRAVRDSGVLTRLITNNTLHVCPPFVVTAHELTTAIADIGEHLVSIERIG